MNAGFWTVKRSAGGLLVASFLILLVALISLFASGASEVFPALLQDSLAQAAPYAAAFRWLNLLYVAGWIVQLLGFSLLARALIRAGDDQLATPAFIAVLIAALLGILHGSFHMSVETWAAQVAAQTGSLPAGYEPLSLWVSSSFRVAYFLHLAAVAVFGWSILRTGILARWLGWLACGWSSLWLVGGLIGAGLPGLLFIMPTVIGVALLRG